MVDPITIGLGVVALATGLSGLVTGIAIGRRGSKAERVLREENEELQRGLDRAQREQRWAEEYREGEIQARQAAERDRDRYRKMAASHEVKLPEITESVVKTGTAWERRRFNGHPKENLANLAKELKLYKGREVQMTVWIDGTGWSSTQGKLLAETWKRGGQPTRELGPHVYHGPAERAWEDFQTFVMDDDTGLMKRDSRTKRKVWRDDDSPLTFEVTLEVTEVIEAPKLPQTHVVEVAVVEEQVRVIEVEKPVYIEVEKDTEQDEATTMRLSREEVHTMVEEAIDRRIAKEEVDALGKLTGMDPDQEADRRRRQRAAHAAKQQAGG